MAATGTVGILRALLTADASAYQKTMKQSADATKAFGSSVTQLGNTTQKVTPQLTRMEKSFQGDKLLYTANNLTKAVTNIGGAAKLTDREMEKVNRTLTEAISKYRALGQAAPKAMLDLEKATRKTGDSAGVLSTKLVAIGSAVGTFVGSLASDLVQRAISGIVNLTRAAIETADRVDDMSKRLGISTDAVQGLKFAAEQSGTTIEAMATAMNKLAVNVSKGGKETTAALKSMGLEVAALQKLGMNEMFLRVTDSIRNIADPVERARVTLALFGRSGAEILAAIEEGIRKVSDATDKMSGDTIRRLAKARDDIDRIMHSLTIIFGETAGAIVRNIEAIVLAWQKLGTLGRVMVFRSPLDLAAMVLGLQGFGDAAKQTVEPMKMMASHGQSAATSMQTLLDQMEGGESAARKQQQQLEAERRSLQSLGLVTLPMVTEKLKEFATQQKRAATEGLDVNRVLVAQIPEMKKLIDAMEASGIESAEARAEYKRMGDAWRASINTSFDAAQGIEGMYEATKHLREEAELLNGIRAPFDAIADATWHLRPDNWIESPEAWRARQEPIKTFWKDELPEVVKDAFNGMTRGMSYALSDMLTGLRGFKQGFLDIWRSIQAFFSDILGSMLNQFISGFLKQMFAAMGGQTLATKMAGWGLGGLVGGAAAGGATAAAAAGTTAAFTAPAAASAAGAAGIASLGWTVGAPTTAGAGFGATLAALATNPFTIAAAGAGLLGLGIWKKGWFRGGEEGTKVNPARDRFLAQFGGFQSLASLLTTVTGEPGGGRLFEKLRTADTMKEFTSASQNILTLLQRRGKMPVSPAESWRLRVPQPALAAATAVSVPAAALTPAAVPARTMAAPTMNVTIQAWDASDMTTAFREEIIPRFKDALQLNQSGLRTAVAGV